MKKVFIITKSGEGHEMDEDRIIQWMVDGSLKAGDLIVDPKRIRVVKIKKHVADGVVKLVDVEVND